MEQIGGSPRVRDDLYHALEAGQKVTAKVQWLSKLLQDRRARWIHCTPLISANGLIGVWMVILVDDDEEPPASILQAELDFEPPKHARSEITEPTPWESMKTDRPQHIQPDRSPSTANSSQTAFSDPTKPVYEKIPSTVKQAPESISLPFASTKLRGPSNAGISTTSTTDLQSDAPRAVAANDRVEANPSRPSTDSAWPRPSQAHPRYAQPPDFQPLPARPGPRIAGRAYSFDSNSEHGISADDGGNSINSRRGASRDPTDRPASQSSNTTAIRSNIQPPDIRWRKPEEQEGPSGRGGKAPIKPPGRASQDVETRPPVWKTKKSLSPYGFLFD